MTTTFTYWMDRPGTFRVFDSAGTYVETLGRGGEGRGEFEVPIGLAVSEGRVLVRDPANGRVQLFGLEAGETEERVRRYRLALPAS